MPVKFLREHDLTHGPAEVVAAYSAKTILAEIAAYAVVASLLAVGTSLSIAKCGLSPKASLGLAMLPIVGALLAVQARRLWASLQPTNWLIRYDAHGLTLRLRTVWHGRARASDLAAVRFDNAEIEAITLVYDDEEHGYDALYLRLRGVDLQRLEERLRAERRHRLPISIQEDGSLCLELSHMSGTISELGRLLGRTLPVHVTDLQHFTHAWSQADFPSTREPVAH